MYLKNIIPASLCLLMSVAPTMVSANTGKVSSTEVASWQLDGKPIDFVQSLDNKKVFFLTDDAKVLIYTPQGQKLGAIEVDKGVNSIDIEPRGNLLYLINKESKKYTALSISITQDIDISGAPFKGDENAPVAMVVFSDFQ